MEQSAREGVIVKGVGGLYYARQPDGEVHVLRAAAKPVNPLKKNQQ